jgi:hypothetical protein
MLHEYHVIYSVRYYLRFHVNAVGLGKYYPWTRGHYCGVFKVKKLEFQILLNLLGRYDRLDKKIDPLGGKV